MKKDIEILNLHQELKIDKKPQKQKKSVTYAEKQN